MVNYIESSKKELMEMGLEELCVRKKQLTACELNLILNHLGEQVADIHLKIMDEKHYINILIKEKSQEWDNA